MTNAQVSCNIVTDTARTAAMATTVTLAALGVGKQNTASP